MFFKAKAKQINFDSNKNQEVNYQKSSNVRMLDKSKFASSEEQYAKRLKFQTVLFVSDLS